MLVLLWNCISLFWWLHMTCVVAVLGVCSQQQPQRVATSQRRISSKCSETCQQQSKRLCFIWHVQVCLLLVVGLWHGVHAIWLFISWDHRPWGLHVSYWVAIATVGMAVVLGWHVCAGIIVRVACDCARTHIQIFLLPFIILLLLLLLLDRRREVELLDALEGVVKKCHSLEEELKAKSAAQRT